MLTIILVSVVIGLISYFAAFITNNDFIWNKAIGIGIVSGVICFVTLYTIYFDDTASMPFALFYHAVF